MFSRKTIITVLLVIIISINIVVLSINKQRQEPPSVGMSKISIAIVAPFQNMVTQSIRFVKTIWKYYFNLVSVAQQNDFLKKELSRNIEYQNRCNEIEQSNHRLRNLINFKKSIVNHVIASEVIGKDPSPWFQTIIIDKGEYDGVKKGSPVVVPEGIVGQVVEVSYHYSKVLLIIDSNSAVDAIIQRTRARGILKGGSGGKCSLSYVLRKNEIFIGDTVVSSGLDGVFPKGIRLGYVEDVKKRNTGIFQDVTVHSFLDFEKLEEVLVVLNYSDRNFYK